MKDRFAGERERLSQIRKNDPGGRRRRSANGSLHKMTRIARVRFLICCCLVFVVEEEPSSLPLDSYRVYRRESLLRI